jgi:hypothetical protein
MLTLHTDHIGRSWIDRGDGISMASFDDSPLAGLLLAACLERLCSQGYNVRDTQGRIIAGDVLATA